MSAAAAEELPELATVGWRPRVDAALLRRRGRVWTAWSLAHAVPFTIAAVALVVAKPFLIVISVPLLAHAVAIPELYANKGAKVLAPWRRTDAGAERTALLLLGDLLSGPARDLHAATGLVLQRGTLGTWLLGEAGAVLVVPGGRRAFCYCVRVSGDAPLPASDRTSHLLLALRADEAGFATVANLAFSGACRRVRRRMPAPTRPALDAAVAAARARARAGGE